MWSRVAALSLASVAALACAAPAVAASPSAGTIAAEGDVRLVMGKLRGIKQADADHPVRIVLRAEGDRLTNVRVVLRNEDDEVVGKSKRLTLAKGERKDVRIEVDGPLPHGRYVAHAKGRTSTPAVSS
jgi:hypothetical protein